MIDEIIEKYRELRTVVANFIGRGKTEKKRFIEEAKKVTKELAKLLEKPEKKDEK